MGKNQWIMLSSPPRIGMVDYLQGEIYPSGSGWTIRRVCRITFCFDFGVLNGMTKLVAWRVQVVNENRDLADHEADKDRLQVSYHPATVVDHR